MSLLNYLAWLGCHTTLSRLEQIPSSCRLLALSSFRVKGLETPALTALFSSALRAGKFRCKCGKEPADYKSTTPMWLPGLKWSGNKTFLSLVLIPRLSTLILACLEKV